MKSNELLKSVGQKIKVARTAKGVSLRKLGALCDLDYSNISRMENGTQDIRLLTLKTIADVLQVEVKDLF